MTAKKLRRAALDYSDLATVFMYDSFEEYRNKFSGRMFMTSSKAGTKYDQIKYLPGDSFVFGPESVGLPQEILALVEDEFKLYIPMTPANRSMNLGNAVSIIAYEAWRQNDFGGSIVSGDKNDGEYYD